MPHDVEEDKVIKLLKCVAGQPTKQLNYNPEYRHDFYTVVCNHYVK